VNIFKMIYARTFQTIMRGASYFLDFGRPETVTTNNVGDSLLDILDYHHVDTILFITDPGITKIGLAEPALSLLYAHGKKVVVFDETVANPTIANIETARGRYIDNGCQALIGFGGGSAIDCAKGVAARLAQPKKSITKLRGLLKVWRRKTLLIAVPTTAGTGSEATLAAVVTDGSTHEKYAINDPHLIPDYAILDHNLTLKLPPSLTASTGMDAMTHAVEAFIGNANTNGTKKAALRAVTLIHHFLFKAYCEPANQEARKYMQEAALEAGVAFTRAYVGHVHAIAHQLGGYYGVPHGLANAIILPIVLRRIGKRAYGRLSLLSDHVGLTRATATEAQKAEAFVAFIEQLNAKMSLKNTFGHLIKDEDISVLAERAYKESYPLYPVPVLWDKRRYAEIYRILQGKE